MVPIARTDPVSSSPLLNEVPPSLDVLYHWLDEQGASRHPALIVEWDDGTGWSVRANGDVPLGSVLCTVPKSCILSHQTASFSVIHPLALNIDEELQSSDYILHLASCLLHELRLHRESRWYGYLQIVPRRTVMIPTFWDFEELAGPDGREALKWLAGTEGDKELRRKAGDGLGMDAIRDYYTAILPSMPATKAHPFPSPFSAFLYALSMVSSRAFVLDTYHTIGIIPFVDLFNHSSRAHTSLACDQNVCATCGSILACEHDSPAASDSAVAGENKSSVSRPDRLQHLSAKYIERLEAEGDNVDMRAERPISAGEEIFSCYEEDVGDGKLLVEWGFVSGEQAGDGLSWSPRDVVRPEQLGLFMILLQSDAVAAAVAGKEGRPTSPPVASSGLQRTKDTDSHDALRTTAESSGSRPTLLAPASITRFGLLNITNEGVVSINLIIAVYLRVLSPDLGVDIEQLEKDFVAVLDGIDQASRDGTKVFKCEESATADLVEAVLTLLDERRRGTFRPELSASDLHDLRNALSPDSVLQNTALRLAENERRVLEKATASWASLLSRGIRRQAMHRT